MRALTRVAVCRRIARSFPSFRSVSADSDLSGKHNILFMSTGIVGGRGKAVVTATGMNTALGSIQKDVEVRSRIACAQLCRLSWLF